MIASYAYLTILAVHLAALALFGGMVLVTDLRLLGLAMPTYSVEELKNGLWIPQRIGFGLAVVSGALLFGWHPEAYLRSPWFWGKMILPASVDLHQPRENPRLAGGLSLLLWTSVVCAGRGLRDHQGRHALHDRSQRGLCV